MMSNKNEKTNFEIIVQKLLDQEDFDEILKRNLSNLEKWTRRYPNHGNWIRKVINDLTEDLHTRIAFGGFLKSGNNKTLCCSIIVKKSPFTPYLELKNLMAFEDLVQENERIAFRKQCYFELLNKIKSYAKFRGYPKLICEMLNESEEDLEIVRALIDEGFVVSGSQSHRYRNSDEIVFLSFDVNQIYGYDPFDNLSASKWIVNRFLNTDKIQESELQIPFFHTETREKILTVPLYYVSYYNSYLNSPWKKFNSKTYFITIGDSAFNVFESEKINNGYFDISKIKEMQPNHFFVFDFTEHQIASSIKLESLTYFNRKELTQLLFNFEEEDNSIKTKKGGNWRGKLKLSSISGLLTTSDPKRFPFKRIRSIIDKGKIPIYIKLGPIGRYIPENQEVYFSYPIVENDVDSHAIWAKAKIYSKVYENINNLRQDYELEETTILEGKTDGQLLFERVYDLWEGEEDNIEFIWAEEDFNKHNAYNATNEVVCLFLKDFSSWYFKPWHIPIHDVAFDTERKQYLEVDLDSYLLDEEIESFNESYRVRSERGHSLTFKEPPIRIKIIQCDYNINTKIQSSLNLLDESTSIGNQSEIFEFLHYRNCNKDGFLKILRLHHDDIVHIYSNSQDVCALPSDFEDGELEPIYFDEISQELERKVNKPFLVILSQNQSGENAELVSRKIQCLCLGVNASIQEKDHSIIFYRFYHLLSKELHRNDLSTNKVINVLKLLPERFHFSLWHNGTLQQID